MTHQKADAGRERKNIIKKRQKQKAEVHKNFETEFPNFCSLWFFQDSSYEVAFDSFSFKIVIYLTLFKHSATLQYNTKYNNHI